MKGFSLSYWSDTQEWRAAHIIDRPNAYGKVESVWRDCPPPENVESKMVAIANAVRSNEIDGFTLFYQPTRKGWQMSIRRKGEPGWDIQIVTEKEAQSVFSMLEARGHPDGPLSIAWVHNDIYAEVLTAEEGPRSIGKHPGLAAPYSNPVKAGLKNLMGELHCKHGVSLEHRCGSCDAEDGQEGIPIALELKAALRRNAAASTQAAELWERLAGLV